MEQLMSLSGDDYFEDEEKVGDSQLSFDPTLVMDTPPCLVCGNGSSEDESAIKIEVNCGSDGDNVTDYNYNGDEIFNWFLKWFRVDILKNKKGHQRGPRKKGWDGEGGEPLHFCGTCKGQLGNLLELQIKVEELEKEIKEGMGLLKGKMEGCEDILQSSGIYERDPRYKKVRSRIVSNVARRNLTEEDTPAPKRKSGRPKKKPVTQLEEQASGPGEGGLDLDDMKDVVPVVVLSSIDKVSADKHLLNVDQSNEATEDPIIEATPKRPKRLATLKKVASDLDDESEEEWVPKKKRKPKDEDFIPESEDDPQDNLCSDNDNDHDESEEEDDLVDSGKKSRRFKEDPSNNLITYGKFSFTILPSESSSSTSPTVQCNLCNLIFSKIKSTIRDHVLKSHTKRYACSQCPSRFTCQSYLNRHILTIHEGQSPKKGWHGMTHCKICGKPINKSGLKRHEWSHMNKEEKEEALKSGQVPDSFRKRWQCDECGHKFGGGHALKLHQLKRHGGGGGDGGDEKMGGIEMELCTECGGSYKDIKNHMRNAHKQGKLFECLENGCGKKFSILSALRKHKDRVHRKIKRWTCPHCPRQFSEEMHFKTHLNNHLGIRPWKCEDCPSDFTAKAALKNHRRIFHEEGSKPKRKSYVRGPTVLGAGVKQEELRRRGEYFPPSALATWAKGREPAEGHVRPIAGEEGGK